MRDWERQMKPEQAAGQRTVQAGRAAELVALLAPALLILGLGLSDGGFGLEARHIAGIGSWLVVILVLVSGRAGQILRLKPIALSAGLLAALAALSLVSSLWSGSVERSFTEANRILVYLGFFLATLLLTQTDKLRQRFAEGLVAAVTILVLLGLGGRLLPEVITVTGASAEGPRIRFPLGYWNANAAMAGIAIALLLWARRGAEWKPARWAATAALPACLIALYFCYSRGGVLAGAVAVAALLALSRHRLGHLLTLVLAIIASLPALMAVQSRRALADTTFGPEVASQGAEVALILVGSTAALLLLLKGLNVVLKRRPSWARPLVDASRHPRVLAGIGTVACLAGLIAIATFGSSAWNEFSNPDLQFPERPESHFGELSGAGRHDFWRVAVDEFTEHPLTGTGAGTYAFSWRADRSIDLIVQDAHSLYLEAFSELGILGGLLMLALIATLLGQAFAAWSSSRNRNRELAAVLTASMLAFALAAAYDWFWELPALGAIFFIAAGVLVSARCSRPLADQPDPSPKSDGVRYGFALSGIALGWVAIALMVGPLIMSFELNRSRDAAAEGRLADATEYALTARSSQPWAASPYIQLGGLAMLTNSYADALEYYHLAADREPDNWQIWLMLAGVAREAGEDSRADRYLERASELNPRAPEFQQAN